MMKRTTICSVFTIAIYLIGVGLLFAQDSFDLRDVKSSPSKEETIDPFSEKNNIESPDAKDDSLEKISSEENLEKESEKVLEEKSTEREVKKEEPEEELMNINFEDVDIRDVIRILANKGQVNMIVGPDIQATVNLQLNNITWKKALNVTLSTYGLTYKEEEGLIRIMTLDQLLAEEEKTPLETKIVPLNFARASEIKSNFENMLSSRGRIDINSRTNSMIVTDIPDKIAEIEKIADILDTRTPQVIIEALIADVVMRVQDELGVDWNVYWPDTAENPQRQFQSGWTMPGSTGMLFDFGTTMFTNKDLIAQIAAWQYESRANILAHPKIMTLDNLTATINLTQEIPYQQQTSSTDGGSVVSTSFKQAGINLSVTPHITSKDNFVYLDLNISQSFQSGSTSGGEPIVDSRSATTNLLVKNGETAVIAGLTRKDDSFETNKVPILGDIPLFGAMFRTRAQDNNDTDLMIFVTPTVLEDDRMKEFSPKEMDRLELFEEDPEAWKHQFDRMKKKKKNRKKVREQTKGKARIEPRYITETRIVEKTIGSKETMYLRPPELK